jgi:hypothetical protein
LLPLVVRGLLVTIAAVLTLSPVSFAGPKTTVPSKSALILVVLADNGIRVFKFLESPNGPSVGVDAFRGPVPRGDILHFKVVNRGTRLHNFTIFGRKTRVLKPGQAAHFTVPALTRGSFRYKSTLDKSAAFRGFFTVY